MSVVKKRNMRNLHQEYEGYYVLKVTFLLKVCVNSCDQFICISPV